MGFLVIVLGVIYEVEMRNEKVFWGAEYCTNLYAHKTMLALEALGDYKVIEFPNKKNEKLIFLKWILKM